jgi:uncharacterized protein (DUF952 family)
MKIFHIVQRDVWASASAAGEYRPPSLDAEGFVHFSFAHQVRATWQHYYSDVPDLIVVEIEFASSDVRVENGFPHVYGPIPTSALVAVHDLDDPLFSAAGPAATDH